MNSLAAWPSRTYITGKGPFSMSLKFIMTFGNVIPERNVKVTLKLCLFGNMALTSRFGIQSRRGLRSWGDEGG
jgi:hypothetical protein